MYVQCYDRWGNRHNFNVLGNPCELNMARVKRHVEKQGYRNVTIVPFVFKG